jgi:hypothetical protein
MLRRVKGAYGVAVVVALAMGAAAQQARAVPAYAVNVNNFLFRFDTTAPGNILAGSQIAPLVQNEQILDIDFRPATGELYGLSSLGNLYVINPATGAALLRAPLTPPLNGTAFGIDFNPNVDRLRVVSDANQNLNVSPLSGLDNGASSPLTYPATPGLDPNVIAVGYLNNVPAAPSTMLFGIDSQTDTLVQFLNPNGGTLTPLGSLGVDTTNFSALDIFTDGAGVNTFFALLNPRLTNASNLYTIDGPTGQAPGTARLIDEIGGGQIVRSIAIIPIPEPTTFAMFALGATTLLARRRQRREA